MESLTNDKREMPWPSTAEPPTRRLRRYLSRLRPGRIRKRIEHLRAAVHSDPIIVLGTQKSGTTAIATLLAIATQETLTSDVFCREEEPLELRLLNGELDFGTFVQRYRAHFANRIIKEPSFTFMYRDIDRTFPHARYVFVLRDPRDTIRSVLDRLALPGDLHDVEPEHVRHLKPYIGWGLILRGVGLPEGETYIDRLALRWRVAAELLIQTRERFELVRYEEFLRNKVESIHGLAARLSLPVHLEIRHRVDTQFQPAGNRAVSWEAFYGLENLARIERICRGPMEILGYPTALPQPSRSGTGTS